MSCHDCGFVFGWTSRKYTCPSCKKGPLCWTCMNNAVVKNAATVSPGQAFEVESQCYKCFQSHVTLDFKKSVDVYGPENGKALSIVMVHGGGGCRLMFQPHAQHFASLGYRCVLLDLPGHGSQLAQPFTIATSIDTIQRVVDEYAAPFNGVKPVYLGGSMGGYLGMEFIGARPDVFSGAVIMMASQNVGKGRSFKAGAGLSAMTFFTKYLSAEKFFKLMLAEVAKRPDLDFEMIRVATLGPSMYFQKGLDQVSVLKSTDSLTAVAKYKGPVLYMQGSLDHADIKDALFKISHGNNPNSQTITYLKADHFFSHDKRFYRNMMTDLEGFLKKIA
eukprot:PhF_6_TR21057/c0_g1_i1/m.30319